MPGRLRPVAPSASMVWPGCQKRSSSTTAPAEASAATMSVSAMEMKLEVRNWKTAKVSPAVSAAGQTSRTPRMPPTTPTSTKGTNSARTGVWRPTIEPSWSAGSPVTVDSVVIGTPMAPNATGAVSAISARLAARIGDIPRASSITAQMATGAPKPARASSREPKQNAMMIAWIRWSGLTPANERRRTSKWPLCTVRL